LALPRQQLQLLRITELDVDLDGPLLKVLVFSDTNLASAADALVHASVLIPTQGFKVGEEPTLKSSGKSSTNAFDKRLQCG